MALFSLSSGALLEVALGNKHQAELRLFRNLWDRLKSGMIFLADRGFCDFVTIVALSLRHVDSVLRLNGSRPHDFRKGKRLGPYDRLVTWKKPLRQSRTATKKLWRSLPEQITLRLICFPVALPGFRPKKIILATTLLDPLAYPAAELAQLYLRRWQVELFLRHIKTTMQMDVLSCKSPEMLSRELMMHLIAYNLIRSVMAQAASAHGVDLERISFKGSVDTLQHFSLAIAQAKSRRQRDQLTATMLAALAGDPLPERPHRIEPRGRKRRPKAYPFLIKPRGELRAKLLGKNAKNQGA